MTDDDLLALCIWDEAANQPYEGKVAVALVIRNRMAAHYASDGTVSGTVLHQDQFSGFWFDFVGGKYQRVCWTADQAKARASVLLASAQFQDAWRDCQKAVADSLPGSGFVGGPEFQKLAADPRALLYDNLDVAQPPWAIPANEVAKIFAHTFFRAAP
jgi:hypothetical protein